MVGKPFLSRHFLAEQASSVASIPFAAAGAADEQGVAATHNLLALGTWSEDAQVPLFKPPQTQRHHGSLTSWLLPAGTPADRHRSDGVPQRG